MLLNTLQFLTFFMISVVIYNIKQYLCADLWSVLSCGDAQTPFTDTIKTVFGKTQNKINLLIMKKFLLSIFAVLFAFAGVQAQDGVWTKVTDASTLQVGDKVVIVAKDYNYALSTTQNTNNRGQVEVTKSGDEVVINTFVQQLTLETGTTTGSFAFNTGKGYLYAASSSNNYLKTETKLSANSSWGITIAANGTATVKAQGTYTRNVMQYNQSSKLFACYSSASQKAICIYKYTEKADDYVEAPKFSGDATFVGSYNVEITAAAGDVYYSYSENGEFARYTGAIAITENTTIYAKAVNGENESAVVSKTYTRVAATPVVSFEGDGKFENEVVVTISAENNATVYYTLDGKTPSAKSTEYTKALTIKADATLKVIAIEEGGYESSIVENKFQLQAATSAGNANAATLVTDDAELAVGDQIVIVATNYDYALSTTQNGNNRGSVEVKKIDDVVSWSSDVQVITLENGKTNGTYAFNVGDGYLYAASSSGNQLKTQSTVDAKASWTVEIETGIATVKAGEVTRNWLRFNNTNNPKIFSAYGSGQTDVSIYKVDIATVEDYVLNVTAAGWATLYLGYNVIIPEDVNCYVIDEIDGELVNLNQVEGVLPANTAVIVEAAKGEYTFEVTEETSTVENVMEGTLKNEYITKDAYVLGIVDGEVGLYKANMAGGVWLNNANKAYLPASVANGAASYSFRFGEGTTAIENVEVENEVKAIFDLTGRKVEAISAPGIYIVNGVKRVVR